MGFFSKLWKGPEVDLEKSGENAKKMRQMFDRVVENGGEYRLISGYTEDVSRFNYGFVHGSRRKVVYGDNVFEKDGIRRDRTGDGEKTRCLCGKRGIFNRDGPAMGPQIIRQLE